MGMETALAHVIPTRQQFGIEITRLDMKLLADMLNKKAYNTEELKALRAFVDGQMGQRLELRDQADSDRFDQSLALYLITRNLLNDLHAVGGGFMSQLEWGSDRRGLPLPVADAMESFFNSTFDHTGRKQVVPFATEADVQGLFTMLFFSLSRQANRRSSWISEKYGNRGSWGNWRSVSATTCRETKRGLRKAWWTETIPASASFDWAAKPGASIEEILAGVAMPLADEAYFPGMGNSVTFKSPGGLAGIAGRLAYSSLSGLFSLSWDEAETAEVPEPLASALADMTSNTWPHSFVVPKYATMGEYKHLPPANHFHMIQGLSPARLEYWMDLNCVLSQANWAARPAYIEGVDRPLPVLYAANGGENNAKLMLGKKL